ncbi:hypothetical protein FB45DRAFT_922884 [Roridomyces roridus]|uniref:Uncharacterized protein n=1 Tax=Roridomyces roridus TaxID=1738132 RepID=A0AAD7FIQ2_9AGAR|nr:hypothetical protein FB45DRAFT_922884 [Roridomyces roridus]
MAYANYQRDVRAKLGFQLVGWPLECPLQSPSTLTAPQIATLHQLLSKGTCRWEPVPSAEREGLLKKYSGTITSPPPAPPELPPKLKITIPAATESAAPSMTFKQLQNALTSQITSGLRKATGNPAICMEYAHYERKIKAQLGFQLVGWPAEVQMKTSLTQFPASFAPVLTDLYQRFLDGKCRWEAIPSAKLEELRKKYVNVPQTRSNRGADGRAQTVSAPNPLKRKVRGEGEGEGPKPKRRTWVWKSLSPPTGESSSTVR